MTPTSPALPSQMHAGASSAASSGHFLALPLGRTPPFPSGIISAPSNVLSSAAAPAAPCAGTAALTNAYNSLAPRLQQEAHSLSRLSGLVAQQMHAAALDGPGLVTQQPPVSADMTLGGAQWALSPGSPDNTLTALRAAASEPASEATAPLRRLQNWAQRSGNTPAAVHTRPAENNLALLGHLLGEVPRRVSVSSGTGDSGNAHRDLPAVHSASSSVVVLPSPLLLPADRSQRGHAAERSVRGAASAPANAQPGQQEQEESAAWSSHGSNRQWPRSETAEHRRGLGQMRPNEIMPGCPEYGAQMEIGTGTVPTFTKITHSSMSSRAFIMQQRQMRALQTGAAHFSAPSNSVPGPRAAQVATAVVPRPPVAQVLPQRAHMSDPANTIPQRSSSNAPGRPRVTAWPWAQPQVAQPQTCGLQNQPWPGAQLAALSMQDVAAPLGQHVQLHADRAPAGGSQGSAGRVALPPQVPRVFPCPVPAQLSQPVPHALWAPPEEVRAPQHPVANVSSASASHVALHAGPPRSGTPPVVRSHPYDTRP